MDRRQPLHELDRAMYIAQHAMRGLGHAGFQHQTHLWLDSCPRQALSLGLVRLCQKHPALAARLNPQRGIRPLYWQFRDEGCPLEERTLESADEPYVLQAAESLLAEPCDLLAGDPPVRCGLFALPAGRGLLILQYSHALLMPASVPWLLGEWDALSRISAPSQPLRAVHFGEPLQRYLKKHSLLKRVQAIAGLITHRPAPALTLSDAGRSTRVAQPDRLLVRTLTAAQTKEVSTRSRQAVGMPAVSMALLASAFRGIARCAPSIPPGRPLAAHIGVLVDPAARESLGNQASFIPVQTKPAAVGDRAALIRDLHGQFRDRVRRGFDLGIAQLRAIKSMPDRWMRAQVRSWLCGEQSLLYGYFGASGPETLCGARVERMHHTVTMCGPTGLSLLANQFRGQLHLAICHAPDHIPVERAARFADALVEDLTT